MMRSLAGLAAIATLALTACPPPVNGDPDGGPDGGDTDGGVCEGQFCVSAVEPSDAGTTAVPLPIAAALLPDDGIAIAYYAKVGVHAEGQDLYEIRYQAWRDGAFTAPEVIAGNLRRFAGLGMAIAPSGEPAVTYLGGDETSDTQAFWFQNDAYLSYRTSGGAWQTTVVAQESNETPSSSPLENAGTVVGLHSAIAFNGDEVLVAWRDVHNGGFGQQDYAGSDLELARGTLSSLPAKEMVLGGDGTTFGKLGVGGHNQMLIVDGQPVIVGDLMPYAADGIGQDVVFYRRSAAGTWTYIEPFGEDVANTQLGPTSAYDPALGFAIAVVDVNSNRLSYVRSSDGVSWGTVERVVQAGSSGWYPSLAIDPSYDEPHIAYYHCDDSTGVTVPSGCGEAEDELRIAARIGTTWRQKDVVVDRAGGWSPRLFFLSTGKRAVVYRDPRAWTVKLAVEP